MCYVYPKLLKQHYGQMAYTGNNTNVTFVCYYNNLGRSIYMYLNSLETENFVYTFVGYFYIFLSTLFHPLYLVTTLFYFQVSLIVHHQQMWMVWIDGRVLDWPVFWQRNFEKLFVKGRKYNMTIRLNNLQSNNNIWSLNSWCMIYLYSDFATRLLLHLNSSYRESHEYRDCNREN